MARETPGKMYALAICMTLLAMVAIVLRFYTRHIKKASYSYDDYMILPAMVSIPCPWPGFAIVNSVD